MDTPQTLPFRYTLRRTLPPWSFQPCLAELEEAIDRWKLDEILVKVDVEEFSHAQVNLEWLDAYLPLLAEAKRRIEARGALFSINPWITVCHQDRGRKGTDSYADFEPMVDIGGAAAEACACPYSKSWRAHTAEVWRRYASLKPHAIWLEDDLRTFWHPPKVLFGCFCEEHRRRFSERAGLDRVVSLEELRAALLQPGEPHPWRRLWLECQNESSRDTAAFLERTVHAVSTETRLGLMSSGPRAHCMEGRRWADLADALSGHGKYPFLSRATMGRYDEVTPLDLYHTADCIGTTRRLLPGAEAELPELENYPYSRVNRSVSSTRAELLLCAVTGCHGAAMNLFDHLGNRMDSGDQYGAMLAEAKPYVAALAPLLRAPGRSRGVNLAFSEDYGKCCNNPEKDATPGKWMGQGRATCMVAGLLGLPVLYDRDAEITFLTAETARALPDATLRRYLSGGLWLDAAAALVLDERGFGELIGVKEFAAPKHPDEYPHAAAEEFLPQPSDIPSYASLFVPCYGDNSPVYFLTPAEGAQVFSQGVDYDGKPLGVTGTVFHNFLGGNILVHAFEYEPYAGNASFCSPQRLAAFGRLLEFLGETPFRVTGDGVCPLAVRRDLDDGRTVAGFMNLSNDPWQEITLHLPDAAVFRRAAVLDEDGVWHPVPYAPQGTRWTLRRAVPARRALFAVLEK